MNNKLILALIIVLFASAYFVGQWLQSSAKTESALVTHKVGYQNCNPVINECVAYIDKHKLALRFMQQPSALKPFAVQVSSDDFIPERIQLEFTMQDMDMGVNRNTLQATEQHLWVADVILPICSLGRNDWVTELQVMYQGELWIAEFGFEQSAN